MNPLSWGGPHNERVDLLEIVAMNTVYLIEIVAM